MDSRNTNITLCVCGSISAYKSADIASALIKNNFNVQTVMTENAMKFITPLTLQTLTHKRVLTDTCGEYKPEYVSHIHYAQDVDLILIAPATANTIGKIANGIADNLVTNIALASNKPILFVPAMNSIMYKNPIMQNNIQDLKNYGCYFLKPSYGELACGAVGDGKIPKTVDIIKAVKILLKSTESLTDDDYEFINDYLV